jgi:hypothetical protein
METTHVEAREFVEEMLRTGLAITDLASSLVEILPDDAYPGEEPAEVIVQMLSGSLQPAVEAAGPEAVRQAMALLGAAYDRAVADLQTAAALSRRRETGLYE